MFFKKILLIFVFFPFFSFAFAGGGFFSEFTCVKDMKQYYPYLLEGKLALKGQKRFFQCLHDLFELFVEKELFVHDPKRDYFTKEEIFKMFHVYFEYEKDLSQQMTDRVFAVKRILIGGSVDQLKDAEIAAFYRLVYDYEEIYFILHTQIPVFKKLFGGSPELIRPAQRKKAMKKINNSLVLLEEAYKRENIVYPVDDLYKYDSYFKSARFFETANRESIRRGAWFLQNLFEGLLSPQKEIRGEDWDHALKSLSEALNLFFYYRTYFSPDMSPPAFTYRILESAEILISSLQPDKIRLKGRPGFPLKNLDEMLSVVFSFFHPPGSSGAFKRSLLAGLKDKSSLSLLTRALNCFSLNRSPEKNCKSKWGGAPSSPVVTLSFEDRQFEIFPDHIKTQPVSGSLAFISPEKLKQIQNWITDYKNDLLDIYNGNRKRPAIHRHFDHWLSPFFGWEKNGRIEFGSFHPPEGNDKHYQLLDYHALVQILFSSYFPEDFFSEGGTGLSLKDWRQIVKDMSPVLTVLHGYKGYQASWRSSLMDLFQFSDSFLYSSNQDGSLSSKELLDMTVHFLEGMKSVRLTNEKVAKQCASVKTLSCTVKTILEDEDILSASPRFQQYLFASQMSKYTEKIETLFSDLEGPVQALDFLALFILIPAIELNYELIDRNQSFNLESEELLAFAKKFEAQTARQIPYLSDEEQARSYLMYSFYTGDMPFFTGDSQTPLKFANWHFNSTQPSFAISPNEFHFLIFDFYNLYKKH